MKTSQNLITRKFLISFSLLIIVFISFGVIAFNELRIVSGFTRAIYTHPLVVSNTALQSYALIVKIHRDMKDIVLHDFSKKTISRFESVDALEQQVFNNLDVISRRILGDEGKHLAEETRNLFGAWRPIREEVIELVLNSNRKAAAEITVGKGADHVAKLENKMLALIGYARGKADYFMESTDRASARMGTILIGFLIVGIVMFSIVAVFTLKQSAGAEKALRESEERLKQLAENIDDVFWVISPDWKKVHYISPAYEKVWGLSCQSLLENPFSWLDAVDEEGMSNICNFIEAKKREDPSEIVFPEFLISRPDGTKRWISARGFPIKNEFEKIYRIAGIAEDITEKKKLDDEIRQSEMILKASQKLTKVGGWEWDIERQSMFWTDEVYQIHDLDAKSVPFGSNEHIEHSLNCYNPDDRSLIITAFERCAEKGQPYDLEFQFTTAKGHKKWIQTAAKPVIRGNKVVSVIGNIIDITKRKQADQERDTLINELRMALDEVKELKGIIPICSYCKNIRDEKGAWDKLEKYISERSDAQFSHGICPNCMKKVTKVFNI